MKVNVYYDDKGVMFICIVLNGVEYDIRVKYDENKDRDTYNLKDLCELVGYRKPKRALERLKKHDYIGSIDKWYKSGYVPDFLVKDLIKLSPCHYSEKLIRLFDKRIFSKNDKLSSESIKNLRLKHSKLEDRVKECLDRVEFLEQSLLLAEEELTDAKNKERYFYEQNNVNECYEFNSDYESDYESTTDDENSCSTTDDDSTTEEETIIIDDDSNEKNKLKK